MINCNPAETPGPVKTFSKSMCPAVVDKQRQKDYLRLIGALLWLSRSTRPDLAAFVSTMSTFAANPSEEMYKAVKGRALRYLKGTMDMGIKFDGNQDLELICYVDADHASSDIDTRRSRTGVVEFVAGGPISWCSVFQKNLVATSTHYSEYVALFTGGKKVVQHKQQMDELGIFQGPVIIYEDNDAAASLANGTGARKQSKHIELKYHYTQDLVERGFIRVERIPTAKNVADIFTKTSLSKEIFYRHRDKMMG